MAPSDSRVRPASPEGWYPDPADPSGATERRWDGAAWRRDTRSAPGPAEPLPHWTRHPATILRHRWFHIFLGALLLDAALLAWAVMRRDAGLIALTAATATVVAIAFGSFLDGRIRMHEVIDAKTVVLVAVVGGFVAITIAYVVEGLAPGGGLWVAVTGPVEEPAKLVVPLLLYARGAPRFRNPRAGLAIVLASAAGLGVLEDALYMFRGLRTDPHAFGAGMHTVRSLSELGLVRPLTDPIIHMSLTGIIAAVAWREWWLRGGFRLTWSVIGAFAAAVALHSGFDLISPAWAEVLWFLVIYAVFKVFARWNVPPNAVTEVPPGWRPQHLPGVKQRRPGSEGP